MRPLLFTIPYLNVPIFGYGVCLVSALFLCTAIARRSARRDRLNPDLIDDLSLILFVSGFLGGRIFFFAQSSEAWSRLRHSPALFLRVWEGGLVLYGALIGGLVAVIGFCIYRRVKLLRLLDVIAPSVALGIAIGRFGCLLNGCCWGGPTDLPWGIEFPAGSQPSIASVVAGDESDFGLYFRPGTTIVSQLDRSSPAASAGLKIDDRVVAIDGQETPSREAMREHWPSLAKLRNGMTVEVARLDGTDRRTIKLEPALTRRPIHPTQLYSVIDGLLLCALTYYVLLYKSADGQGTATAVIGYAISRFFIEMLRDDDRPVLLGLTISQAISLLVLVAGVWVWIYSKRFPRLGRVDEMRQPTAG